MTAVHLIDPARTLVIADFGSGSDTLIALDYRNDLNQPSVIRLKWRDRGANNIWIRVAPNFDAFMHLLFD